MGMGAAEASELVLWLCKRYDNDKSGWMVPVWRNGPAAHDVVCGRLVLTMLRQRRAYSSIARQQAEGKREHCGHDNTILWLKVQARM